MADNQMNIGVGVSDLTSAGIRSVIKQLNSLPQGVTIGAELSQEWGKELLKVRNDALGLQKLIEKINNHFADVGKGLGKQRDVFGKQYMTGIIDQTNILQKNLINAKDTIDSIFKRSGKSEKGFFGLESSQRFSAFIERGVQASAVGPDAVKAWNKEYSAYASKFIRDVSSEAGIKIVDNISLKQQKAELAERDRLIKAYIAQDEKIRSMRNQTPQSLLRHYNEDTLTAGKQKIKMGLAAERIAEISARYGLENQISSAQKFVSLISRANSEQVRFNQLIEQNNAKFGANAAAINAPLQAYLDGLDKAVKARTTAGLKEQLEGGRIQPAIMASVAARRQLEMQMEKELAAEKQMAQLRIQSEQQILSMRQSQKRISETIAQINKDGIRGVRTPDGQFALNLYRQITAVNRELDNAIARMNRFSSNPSGAQYKLASSDANRLQEKANGLIAEYNRHQEVRNARAQEYVGKLNAIKSAMQSQSSVAADLRNQIVGMYSIYQVKSFLKSIIDIGGQFEYQRAAIGAILGDASKANTLFNQIKDMALRSPFNTLQLDQYTKQLAAFQVPYSEMIDKLKQLGDIAAATGTDMGRIIYAYGHVRSSGFMNAMQLRQFTNANIPMLPELQKIYSERQGGAKVTRDDVYKMLKSHQVALEDVEEVFDRLTKKGGRFANMQEVMADTVKGVWKNLGDAINHMYLGIENSQDSTLKDIGKDLTALTKFIANHVDAIKNVAIAVGVFKAGQYAMTLASGKSMNASIQAAAALERQEVAALRAAAAYRKLDVEERLRLAPYEKTGGFWSNMKKNLSMRGTSTQGLMQAWVNNQMSKNDILRGIHTGSIGANTARGLVKEGLISAEEAKKANAGLRLYTDGLKKATLAGSNLRYTMTGALNTIKLGAQTAAVAMGQFALSMAPMLAISAVIGIWSSIKENAERAKQAAKEFAESMNSGLNGITEAYDNFKSSLDESGGSESKILEAEKETVQSLKDNLVSANIVLAEIYAKDESGNLLLPAEERAKRLEEELVKLKEGFASIGEEGRWESISSAFEHVANQTSAKKNVGQTFFGDDLDGKLEKYTEALGRFRREFAGMTRKDTKRVKDYVSKISAGIKEMDQFRDAQGKLNDDLESQLIILSALGKLDVDFADDKGLYGLGSYSKVFLDDIKNITELFDEFRKYASENEDLSVLMKDPNLFREAFMKWAINAEQLATDEAERLAVIMSHKVFGTPLTFVPKIDKKGLKNDDSWKKELEKLFSGKDGKANAEFLAVIRTSVDIVEARKKCQELWDSLEGKWSELQKAGKAFGINLDFSLKAGSNTKALRERLIEMQNTARANGGNLISKNVNQAELAKVTFIEEILRVLDAVDSAQEAIDKGFLDIKEEKKAKSGSERKNTSDEGLKKRRKEMEAFRDMVTAYTTRLREQGVDAAEALMNTEVWKEQWAKYNKYFKDGVVDFVGISEVYKKEFADLQKVGAAVGELDKEGREAFHTEALKQGDESMNQLYKFNVDIAVREIDKLMEKQKRAYELYKKNASTTGNLSYASKVAFGSTSNNYVDRVEDLKARLQEALDGESKRLGGRYTVAELLGLDEETLKRISPTVHDIITKYRKEIEYIKDAAQESAYELLNSIKTYEAEMSRINAKAQINASIAKNNLTGEVRDKALAAIEADRQRELLEKSDGYIKLMDSAYIQSFDEATSVAARAYNTLIEQLNAGTISASEYRKKVKELNDAMQNNTYKKGGKYRVLEALGLGDQNPVERWIKISQQKALKKYDEEYTKAYETRRSGFEDVKNSETWQSMSKTDLGKSLQEQIMKQFENGDDSWTDKFKDSTDSALKDGMSKVTQGSEGMTSALKGASGAMGKMGNGLAIAEKIVKAINGSIQGLNDTFKELRNTMKSLGNEQDDASSFGQFSNYFDAVAGFSAKATEGFDKFKNGDFLGAFLSNVQGIVGMIGEFARTGDKVNEALIQRAQKTIDQLETTNYILDKDIQRKMGNDFSKRMEYLNNLKKQREEIKKQQELEEGKKDKDESALNEYTKKLKDAADEIRYYWQDFWAEMGIDLKDWSKQLADALTEAWSNGMDAAQAWHDKVGDLMRGVAKDWISKKYIEAALAPLERDLFGEGGMLTNGKELTGETLRYIEEKLGGLYDGLSSLQPWWNEIDEKYPQNRLQGSITASEQSMTEGTANLLASYVNAIREQVGQNSIIAQSQLTQLNAIAQSNQAIADNTAAMRAVLEASANGSVPLNVR